MIPIGAYRVAFSVISTNFIFNSITTNKNRIAMAPTYTITNKIGRNSTPSNNKSNDALANARTNQKTLKIGFLDVITFQALKTVAKLQK